MAITFGTLTATFLVNRPLSYSRGSTYEGSLRRRWRTPFPVLVALSRVRARLSFSPSVSPSVRHTLV